MADTPPAAPPASTASRGQTALRRILVFAILFALIVIAAVGVGGLLARALGLARVLATSDTDLARSLAFALVGVPLAGLLWWWQRRRLALDPGERASLVWALYLTAMTLTALIGATVELADAAAAGIDGRWAPASVAYGLVWSGVWVWHTWMRRTPAIAPTRLSTLPTLLGGAYGVVLGALGAVGAISTIVSAALVDRGALLVEDAAPIVGLLQALVWAGLGILAWWWHWHVDGGRVARGPFASVILVVITGAAAAATLFAAGTILWVLLRLVADPAPRAEVLAPLDTAVATALVAGLVWASHHAVVATRPEPVSRAARLVLAAVALVGAASGFGVVVNALLATIPATLVAGDPRSLLLGGLSALVVGFPVWWLAWHPERSATVVEAADTGRRVYLVVIFGVSAVVAIVTLLLIGFRVFDFFLGASGARGLVERVRAPLGLLSATAAVFAYHFAVWRRDRALVRAAAPAGAAPASVVAQVILVSEGDAADAAARLRAALGAKVTVWQAAAGQGQVGEADVDALVERLRSVATVRALVIAESGAAPRIVPLSG
ncbi:DUF5671 domain-containing protein [Microbacterium hominis]|uniref:DUF5671 domain-containing protein n=1 Tax=Microbacterium hominis TaxID=162426 RepID=A0A7D4QBR3_9MICO|nr:DUF5671 domain-containing protein [Microbacterium hominis]QKJ18757.1 hypothetical protein HQM25_04730 [Microbacterium hominis]